MTATLVEPATVASVPERRCSRTACHARAVATLTYAYADRTAVVGSLSLARQPGAYDLCRDHAHALSVPVGWEVIRLPESTDPVPQHSEEDLMALADAVRAIGLRHDDPVQPVSEAPGVVVLAERRHLRVIADRETPRG